MSLRAVVNHRLMVPNLALQDCPRAPPEFRGGDGDVWTKKVNNQKFGIGLSCDWTLGSHLFSMLTLL